ncbi:GSCFA domain-containing protein [Aegicerativicinus sediminis]|uniref:GSCFA domain-containing protein n=1 Tax=Aegicerativicinus sediminis TaxID=2893202 RepID=UPI001E42C689|nr:GSCFA domain-containing protein [Aegicerativicinus sediminis]
MDFRTRISISEKGDSKLNYNSKLFGIGSCFAENLGDKLDYFQFQNLTNPFGVIFNPNSICRLLDRIVNSELFKEEDCFFFNDQWQSYELHSRMNAITREEFLNKANSTLTIAHNFIKSCTHLVLTLGTAWVYELKDNSVTVANCHKVPQDKFLKRLLSKDEIQDSLSKINDLIRAINNEAIIIYTISPVRHLKDGFVENNISKSQLLVASYEFTEQLSHWYYFPSYEILMDDLRDYRFYAEDMLHPNSIAIDYVWEKFSNTLIAKDVVNLMKKVDSIRKRKRHIPFNPDTESHKEFLKKLEIDIESLKQFIPNLETDNF